MTDRELLELAAKAVGMDAEWSNQYNGLVRQIDANGRSWEIWNPLRDDGDAFRLAVKLGMSGCFETIWGEAIVEYNRHQVEEGLGDDRYAAARRAIVRAVAEKWGGIYE